MNFGEMLQELKQGKKLRLPEWGENYIMLDQTSQEIIVKYMQTSFYTPRNPEILSNDWTVV